MTWGMPPDEARGGHVVTRAYDGVGDAMSLTYDADQRLASITTPLTVVRAPQIGQISGSFVDGILGISRGDSPRRLSPTPTSVRPYRKLTDRESVHSSTSERSGALTPP